MPRTCALTALLTPLPLLASMALAQAPQTTTPAPAGSASDADIARAEALFTDGKALLAAKDFAGACGAFAASHGLDPATGTLLALAMCHEAEGKRATAAREYREVSARAMVEGRTDRASAAQDKASALEPTLSRLVIQRDAAQSDLRLRLDGVALTPEQVGTPLPVDGGRHTVDALRGEDVAWSTQVTLAESGDEQRVVVPLLVEPQPEPAVSASREARVRSYAPKRAPARADRGLTTGQWAGLLTLGAAAVSFGIGTGYTLVAVSANDDSESGCDGDLCTSKARQQRLDARHAGNVATVSFMTGAALATVGVAIYFAYPQRAAGTERASGVTVDGWADQRGAGARVGGSF